MPTAFSARTRNAGLLTLTLTLSAAALAAAPVQAAPFTDGPSMGSSDHRDCDSRRDAKIYFEQYGLKHVDVSKTHDRYVYLVKGIAPVPREEVELKSSMSSKSDYIHYVILFDGCDHSKTRVLKPET